MRERRTPKPCRYGTKVCGALIKPITTPGCGQGRAFDFYIVLLDICSLPHEHMSM